MTISIQPIRRAALDLKTSKAILPAILGTVLEYYDYTLYGFCACLIAPQFFPNEDPSVALLKTFGIFLFGSFSKPLGALIFGAIGDRLGRRVALQISMLGIALPTFLMGLIPSYAQIGWLAPLLLLFCRIAQGICTAGESDGVRIYIFETIGQTRPCFANSLAGVACMLGIYLASFVSSQIIAFDFSVHAWRAPFLLGGVLGAFVYWYRFSIQESLEFTHAVQSKTLKVEGSWLKILSRNKRAIVVTILLCGATGGGYHFYLVFFGNYLSTVLNIIDPVRASINTSIMILIYTLCAPIAGLVADRLGALQTLKFSALSLFGLILLNAGMVQQGIISIWLLGSTAVALSFFSAPGYVVILQKFKVEERYRCSSFGHAIGSMFFSGSAPFLSLGLWQVTGLEFAPLLYFAFLALMGLIAAGIKT